MKLAYIAIFRQKCHNELDMSPLTPLATKINETNGDPLSPTANASTGANGTPHHHRRQWLSSLTPLVPSKWRQWRHQMTMSWPGSPSKGRGAIVDKGNDSINGHNGDSMATMVIHWLTKATMASLVPMVTMVRVWVRVRISTIVAIATMALIGSNGTICDPLFVWSTFVPRVVRCHLY